MFFLLIPLACLFAFSSDIYAPSIPDIAKNMHASMHDVQATMPMMLLGTVLSLPIFGFIMEIYGRKNPIIIGLLILIFGNILAINANSVYVLNLARIIQGCGAAASMCGWRTLFSDNYTKAEIAKYGGYCSIIMAFMVPAAPLIGGILHETYTWHATFYFMIIYSLIIIIMILKNLKENQQKIRAKVVSMNLAPVLKNRSFIYYSLASLCTYGAFFSWFVAGPALIISTMGYSPSYFGLLTFKFGSSSIALAGFVNGKYVKKLGCDYFINLGLYLMLFSGISLIILFYVVKTSIYAIYVPITFLYLGLSFSAANLFAVASSELSNMKAMGSSIYSTAQISGGVILGYISAHMPDDNQLPFAILIVSTTIIAIILKTLGNKYSNAAKA